MTSTVRLRCWEPGAVPAGAYARDALEELGKWDAISERSWASLEQLGTTLNGYPQLAGETR